MPRARQPRRAALTARLGTRRARRVRRSRSASSARCVLPYADHAAHRRARPMRDYLARAPGALPRPAVSALPAPYPSTSWPPSCWARRRGHPGELKQQRFQRRARRARSSARTASSTTYDRYLRGTRRRARSQVDALGQPERQSSRRAARSRAAQMQAVARPRPPEGRPAGAAAGDRHARPAIRPRRRVRRARPAQRRDLAMGSEPSLRPDDLRQADHAARRYDAAELGRPTGAPLFNRAIAGAYPTGSTFKPITALAALQRASSRPARRSTTPAASVGAQRAAATPATR